MYVCMYVLIYVLSTELTQVKRKASSFNVHIVIDFIKTFIMSLDVNYGKCI